MSEKGKVGKTSIAVNLAYAFAGMNYSVGILDADLYGKKMKCKERRRTGHRKNIIERFEP